MNFLKDVLNTSTFSLENDESYFLYDLNQVSKNIHTIRNHFKNLNQIYFSVKSNPSEILLRHFRQNNINFDVSSAREFNAVLKVTNDAQCVTVSGPAKAKSFLERSEIGSVKSVHLDSLEEFEALKKTSIPLTVRWPLESSYSQKVGFPNADLLRVVNECQNSGRLTGVHIYIGRERATKEIVQNKFTDIKNFISANRSSFIDKPVLFWGGGLPIVKHVLPEHFPDDPEYEINLECGRALIHDCGLYLTQILEVKEKNAENIVIINGGLQHLASHFGSPRFGQQDVTVSSIKKSLPESKIYNIYGSLGISTDILVKQISLSIGLSRGDWLVFGPAGGYGYSAGTNQFLGSNAAQEIFYLNGKIQFSTSKKTSYLESGLYESKDS